MGAKESKIKSPPKTSTRIASGSRTRSAANVQNVSMKTMRSPIPDPVLVWPDNSVRWQSLYDIYICHSQEEADCSYAMEMLSYLENQPEKLRCFLPMRDMLWGGSIPSEMCRGLENSHCWVMLLTPHFLSDSWCTYQMHQFLTQAPCSNGRLIPVIIGLPFELYPSEVKHMYYLKDTLNDKAVFDIVKNAILKYLKVMITITDDRIPANSPNKCIPESNQSPRKSVEKSQRETQESTSDVSKGSLMTLESTSNMSSTTSRAEKTTGDVSLRTPLTQEIPSDRCLGMAAAKETTSGVSLRSLVSKTTTSDMSMKSSVAGQEVTSDISIQETVTEQDTTNDMSMGSTVYEQDTMSSVTRQETASVMSMGSTVTEQDTTSSVTRQDTTNDMSMGSTVTEQDTTSSVTRQETTSDMATVTEQDTTSFNSMRSTVTSLETPSWLQDKLKELSLLPPLINNKDISTDCICVTNKDSFSHEKRLDTCDSGIWSISKDFDADGSSLYTSDAQLESKHLHSNCSELYTSVSMRSGTRQETNSDMATGGAVTEQDTPSCMSMRSSVTSPPEISSWLQDNHKDLSLLPPLINNRDICTNCKCIMNKDSFSHETRLDTLDSGIWSMTKDLMVDCGNLYTNDEQMESKHLLSNCSEIYTSAAQIVSRHSHSGCSEIYTSGIHSASKGSQSECNGFHSGLLGDCSERKDLPSHAVSMEYHALYSDSITNISGQDSATCLQEHQHLLNQ